MKAAEQETIWDHYRKHREREIEKANNLGPFSFGIRSTVYRYFDCPNYDACLSYAAFKMWNNFTCLGCRRTKGLKIK